VEKSKLHYVTSESGMGCNLYVQASIPFKERGAQVDEKHERGKGKT